MVLVPHFASSWESQFSGSMSRRELQWRYFGRQFSSVQSLSHVRLFATARTGTRQASLSISNSWSLLKLCPSSWWCHPTISSSVIPFSCLQSCPASGSFPISQAKVLEFQLQHQSFQWIFRTDFLEDWLVGSPCNPRDSQEYFPTPQFKSINSSALSFPYSPTLISIHFGRHIPPNSIQMFKKFMAMWHSPCIYVVSMSTRVM